MLWILMIIFFIMLFILIPILPIGTVKYRSNSTAVLTGMIIFIAAMAILFSITEGYSLSFGSVIENNGIMLVGIIVLFLLGIVIPIGILFTKEQYVIVSVKAITNDPMTYKPVIVFEDSKGKLYSYISTDPNYKVGQLYKVDLFRYGSAYGKGIGLDGKPTKSLSAFTDNDFEIVFKSEE